jgi:serine/threonine protein kinase
MNSCPSTELLEQRLSESLPEAQASAVDRHVQTCLHCQQWLERRTSYAELRGAAERAWEVPAACDRKLAQLLDRLCNLPLTRISDDTPLLSPHASSVVPLPSMLGPYRLETEIGRGGMGIVFRAFDELLQRTVAIKVLRPEHDDAAARTRLVREAQLAARFRHDHVVTVYAVVDRPDSLPYLVMEYVPGPTLKALLRQPGGLAPAEAARLAAEVADGLAAAHAAGLIHRDIKPSNVLMDSATGRARLSDFGLARLAADLADLTRSSALVGTPEYMSPEQVQCRTDLDGRTDVYSLGVTLYEALTGEAPFRGTLARVLDQILHEEPRLPRQLNETVPRDLETICLKALAKEPGRRYPTAMALAEDLRRFLQGKPIQARPARTIERSWRWCRRNPRMAALAAALVLAVTIGLAGVLWQWWRAEAEATAAQSWAAETDRQRRKAHENFLRARAAVDKYLTEVSEDADLQAHNLEPLRRKLLRTARDYYEQFVREHPADPDLQAELGRAYGRLGSIVAILDSPPRSLELFENKRAIFERLHRAQPQEADYQSELADTYWRLGYAQHYVRPGPDAWEAFRQARALWQNLAQRYPDEPKYSARLVRTLNSLGRSYQIASPLDGPDLLQQAEQAFQEGQAVAERWERDHATGAEYQESLVLLLGNLGSLYRITDRLRAAQPPLERAVLLAEHLVDHHPQAASYQAVLFHALTELSQVYYMAGSADSSETTLTRAGKVAERLIHDHPGNGEYRAMRADAHCNLGDVFFHQRGRPAEARPKYEEALVLCEQLITEFPGVWPYWGSLYASYGRLEALLQEVGDFPAARELLDRAIRRWESASLPRHLQVELRSGLARFYGRRALARVRLAEGAAALEDCEQALQLCDPVEKSRWRRVRLIVEGWLQLNKGDHVRSADLAQTVVAQAPTDDEALGLAAGLLSRTAEAVDQQIGLAAPERARLAEQYAAAAVSLLQRQIQAARPRNAATQRARLRLAYDFRPLRQRADFLQLLTDGGGLATQAGTGRN